MVVFYALFVALLAFSPILGFVIGTAVGLPLSFHSALAFMWVGVGLSLPASLGAARAFGGDKLEAYWLYLESFRNHSRRRIIAVWACASIASLLFGVAMLLLP